jgi:hypothetical protein
MDGREEEADMNEGRKERAMVPTSGTEETESGDDRKGGVGSACSADERAGTANGKEARRSGAGMWTTEKEDHEARREGTQGAAGSKGRQGRA